LTLYDDPFFIPDSVKVKPQGDYLAVVYKEKQIASVSIVDALWENTTQPALANKYASTIKNTIVKYKEQNSLKNILIRLSELCLVLFIAFILVWGINWLFRFLRRLAVSSQGRFVSGIKVKNYELIKK
jgi:mscS mechanosensitive ion channel